MIESVAQLYRRHKILFYLALWGPPAGIEKAITIHDCGAIEVTLSLGLFYEEGVWLGAEEKLSKKLFAELEAAAARLLWAVGGHGPAVDPDEPADANFAEAEERLMAAIWDVERRHGHE